MKFVLLFSQEHLDFRIAEIRGICAAFSLKFDVEQINSQEHIFVVEAEEDEVRRLLSRSMLLKSAYLDLYCSGSTAELLELMQRQPGVLAPFNEPAQSFSVRVRPSGRKKGIDCLGRAKLISHDIPLDLAPVDLKNPKNAFTALEHYENEQAQEPFRVYFGLLVGHGQSSLQTKYNLKERRYIGNTTMDPELAFIQANITAVRPNALVLDPFVGTGGLLLPAAEFGGYVVGGELNYQVARGIGKSARHGVKYLTEEESIAANFDFYKTRRQLLSIVIADASQHGLWRDGAVFEAIVSDPPYGVREKGRKVGKKNRKEHWTLPSSEHSQHFPEKQHYSIEDTYLDLCDLAAKVLTVDGRVSFWFPVILANYSLDCLPYHPALELVENCEQRLTKKTSRRLLTYRKVREPVEGEQTTAAQNIFENGTFRDAVFTRDRR